MIQPLLTKITKLLDHGNLELRIYVVRIYVVRIYTTMKIAVSYQPFLSNITMRLPISLSDTFKIKQLRMYQVVCV